MTLNRIVCVAVAVLSLVAAVAPALANMDGTSTAGVITGIASVDAIALKWLTGWQKYEADGRDGKRPF